MRRFNDWLALRLSAAFSTMACFYAFLILSLLPLVWHNSMEVVQFISSGVLQLVALPLLAVAAKVINDKADQHAKEISDLHEKHDKLHERLSGSADNG